MFDFLTLTQRFSSTPDCGAQLLPFHDVPADILWCSASFPETTRIVGCHEHSYFGYVGRWTFLFFHSFGIFCPPNYIPGNQPYHPNHPNSGRNQCVVYPFEDLSFALKVPSLIRPKGRMAASLADLQGIQKHGQNTFFSSLFGCLHSFWPDSFEVYFHLFYHRPVLVTLWNHSHDQFWAMNNFIGYFTASEIILPC